MAYIFSVPIDWKELAPTALWALQETYPDIDILFEPSLEEVANMYSPLPIEEGSAALGQELSHHGYALYNIDAGNDESVFLLLQSDVEPLVSLYGVLYKDRHTDEEEDEENEPYEVDAELLLQTGHKWGQKAKRIICNLKIRLPKSSLLEVSGYQPEESFHLPRNLTNQSGDQQDEYTKIISAFDTRFRTRNSDYISSHKTEIKGDVCHLSDCAGLPSSKKGFLVSVCNNQGFTLNVVDLDTEKVWQRSLKGMQPNFDKCRYQQHIHPKLLPDGWVLLDIIGDNFGLADCAWLWHTTNDQFFAIPLAAVTDDYANATFHYHHDMNCLFALSGGSERHEILERLVPLPEMLAAITQDVHLARVVEPWIALSDAKFFMWRMPSFFHIKNLAANLFRRFFG
jgi:hypothetical protein